ncbi:TonB-dependent receptor [Ascidiimonas aurantiaca]|uniref:TonB-dependent receptor n=1 Tax=Ascidiimonas aurantiaca TaxID=1685432 RepID=UPI0030EBF53A
MKILFSIILCCTGFLLYAQQKIQLTDAASGTQVTGATFIYGDQKGVSNEKGHIEIIVRANTSLIISHIQYGRIELKPQEVTEILKSGDIRLYPITTQLQPVTVIAIRPEKGEKEVLNLSYLDKMQHDGGALLNQSPAINSIRKSGSYAFDPVIRGFKYDQLNIVINGAQSAIAACPNRMDTPSSQIPVNMMQRVEILKGPHALRYGNAVGATINFVPVTPWFTEKITLTGRVSSGYDANGNVSRNEGQFNITGKRTDMGIFASYANGDDYQDGNGEEVPANFSRGSFGINLGWQLSENQQLTFSTTYNRARDVDFPALPMDMLEDDTWLFNARHDVTINNKHLTSWNSTVYGTFVNHLMSNTLRDPASRMTDAETNAKTHTYGARTEGIWTFSNRTLYVGADVRLDKAEGVRARTPLMGPNAGSTFFDNAWQNSRIFKSGLFAEYRIQNQTWQYILSGRINLNDARINDEQSEFNSIYSDTGETQINPSISLGAVKSFNSEYSLGIWLSRAQRSGSITERYINFFPVGQDRFEMLGNPLLDPEINNQADITLHLKKNKTQITFNVFAAYLQDFISSIIDPDLEPRLGNSPGVRQFINIDEAFKTGFEITWNQELFAGLQHQLSGAYTLGEDLERDEPLPEIPPLDIRYTLSGNYFKGKLKPSFTLRHVLEQNRVSPEFGEPETPSFTNMDIAVQYELTKNLRISVQVQNLFDEAYFEHLNRAFRSDAQQRIFAPGRNISFAANLNIL